MTRNQIVSQFLKQTDWRGWVRQPIAGDASARSYERLVNGPRSAVLMNAPPNLCGEQEHFVSMARHLRAAGLCAPEIFLWERDLGIIVMEDLGQHHFAAHLQAFPKDEYKLYKATQKVLAALQDISLPSDLIKLTPQKGASMLDVFFEWACPEASTDLRYEFQYVVEGLLRETCPDPSTLALRDFHAENLIWRPEKSGLGQVGLLDFQDAFIAPPLYDLVSLLRDARRDVNPGVLEALMPQSTNARATFSVLALQRNLRILGVFHRLAKKDNKPGYLSLLPRVVRNIQIDLEAPVAQRLKPLFLKSYDNQRVSFS